MVHTMDTTLWFGVVVAGSMVLLWTALRARAHWDEPGGEAFSGLALAAALASGYLGLLYATGYVVVESPRAGGLLSPGGVLGWPINAYLALYPVVWGVFAAQRKGLTFFTRRRRFALAGAVGGILVALQALHWIRPVLTGAVGLNGVDTLFNSATFVLFVALLLTVPALVMLGTGLLLYVAYENEHVGVGRRLLLSLGTISGWLVAYAARLMGTPLARSEVLFRAGVMTGVTAATFALAVTRYNVFEESVAAVAIGRDEVVETMEDAVVVVNDEGEVLDMNPVASRLFEVDLADVAGEPVEDVVGEPLSRLRTDDLLALETLVGLREFEPRASVVTGAGGDVVGFSVVLRDVTERRTREERLQVLNRVLRHNLRNEVSVISGYAELLADAGAAVALDRAATEISETAYELAEIGEKARTIERMMAESPNGTGFVPVADLVERAVEPVADAHPDCHIAVDVPDDLEIAANSSVLVPVLENVVENAAEHNDRPEPHVEIRASEGVDPTTVTFTIVDDGPGIPEDERTVLESGDVTPLEHGSGLGLWVAKWGVTRLGGELSFSATEPRGTIVTIRLPAEGPDEDVVEGTAGRLAA